MASWAGWKAIPFSLLLVTLIISIQVKAWSSSFTGYTGSIGHGIIGRPIPKYSALKLSKKEEEDQSSHVEEEYQQKVALSTLKIEQQYSALYADLTATANAASDGDTLMSNILEEVEQEMIDPAVQQVETLLFQIGKTYQQFGKVSAQSKTFIRPTPGETQTRQEKRKTRQLLAQNRETKVLKRNLQAQMSNLEEETSMALAKVQVLIDILRTVNFPSTSDGTIQAVEQRKFLLVQQAVQRLEAAFVVLEKTTQQTHGEEAARSVGHVLNLGNRLVNQLKDEEGATPNTTSNASPTAQSPMQASTSMYDPTDSGASSDESINVAEVMPTAEQDAAAAVAKRYQQKQKEYQNATTNPSNDNNATTTAIEEDVVSEDPLEVLREAEKAVAQAKVSSETLVLVQPANTTVMPALDLGGSAEEPPKITLQTEEPPPAPKPNSKQSEEPSKKSSSIWSKLGIPSRRAKTKAPTNLQIEIVEPQSNTKNNKSTKRKAKKTPVIFWSSLIQDLYTVPTIVVPAANATSTLGGGVKENK